MSELFQPETVQQDSPRLEWMKRHGVMSELTNDSDKAVPYRKRWLSTAPERPEYPFCGEGETEEESLREWGILNQVRLWNEQGVIGVIARPSET